MRKIINLFFLLSSTFFIFQNCSPTYHNFENSRFRYSLSIEDVNENNFHKFQQEGRQGHCYVCNFNRFLEIKNGYFYWSTISYDFLQNDSVEIIKNIVNDSHYYPIKFVKKNNGFYVNFSCKDSTFNYLQYSLNTEKNERIDIENITPDHYQKDGFTEYQKRDSSIYVQGEKYECYIFKEVLSSRRNKNDFKIVYLEKKTAIPIMIAYYLEFANYSVKYNLVLSKIESLN